MAWVVIRPFLDYAQTRVQGLAVGVLVYVVSVKNLEARLGHLGIIVNKGVQTENLCNGVAPEAATCWVRPDIQFDGADGHLLKLVINGRMVIADAANEREEIFIFNHFVRNEARIDSAAAMVCPCSNEVDAELTLVRATAMRLRPLVILTKGKRRAAAASG